MTVGDLVKPSQPPTGPAAWTVGLIVNRASPLLPPRPATDIFWCVLIHGDRVVVNEKYLEVINDSR
jgi:hypothetical protein